MIFELLSVADRVDALHKGGNIIINNMSKYVKNLIQLYGQRQSD